MRSFMIDNDDSKVVISAKGQIEDENHGRKVPAFPKNAVLFCYNYGLQLLKEKYHAKKWIEKLPRFLSGCEVLKIDEYPDVCFLHGGSGAPMMADTMETLIALGVENFYLLGLCGVYDGIINVGDIVVPTRVLSEEGTTRHYFKSINFVDSDLSLQTKAYDYFQNYFKTYLQPIVTTDAIYRQTFKKEAYWRDLGCVGVDMESSAFLSLCKYYNKTGTVILMVSDKHPLSVDDSWVFGNENFMECRKIFTQYSLTFILNSII